MLKIRSFLILFILSFSAYNSSQASPSSSIRVWSSVEYLYLWVKDSSIAVPLITQNDNSSAFGIINEPGTRIIFGAGSLHNTFDFGGTNGLRLTLGGWLDNSYLYGLEMSGFGLSQQTQHVLASSVNTSIPIVNIPFFSTRSGENVLVRRLANTVTINDTFQPLSIELNGMYQLQKKTSIISVLLAGFRYLNIDEKLKLNDAIYGNSSLPPNSILNVRDIFSTHNNFYGFQLGERTQLFYGNLIAEVLFKIALGANIQALHISGQTNINDNIILQQIGLFAEPSNRGAFNKKTFAILPELQMKMGYQYKFLLPFISYQVIYINHIIRPGEEIDREINQSQNALIGGSGVLSGRPAPSPQFKSTNLWMQGISAGIEFHLR